MIGSATRREAADRVAGLTSRAVAPLVTIPSIDTVVLLATRRSVSVTTQAAPVGRSTYRAVNRRDSQGLASLLLERCGCGQVEGGRRLRRVSPETTITFDVATEALVRELTVDD